MDAIQIYGLEGKHEEIVFLPRMSRYCSKYCHRCEGNRKPCFSVQHSEPEIKFEDDPKHTNIWLFFFKLKEIVRKGEITSMTRDLFFIIAE